MTENKYLSQSPLPNHQEVKAAYRKGQQAVIALFDMLVARILNLESIVQALQEEISKIQDKLSETQDKLSENQALLQELKDQMAKNSQNSHKPPSTDGFKKPIRLSLKPKSGRKSGGQLGHEGKTLNMVEKPDLVKIHRVRRCRNCKASLEGVPEKGYEKRQVFDIPFVSIKVTEHRAEIKVCPNCGEINKGDFPERVINPAQYGQNIKALMVYLNQYHFIPLKRVREIFYDLYCHSPSEGSIFQAGEETEKAVFEVNEKVREYMTYRERVVHFDESGMRVKGGLNWLHCASSEGMTYYAVTKKRGGEGMDEVGILPKFCGTAVHDYWRAYFRYDKAKHAICNAHNLRELRFIYERYGQEWAKGMIDLLLEIKGKVDEAKGEGMELSKEERDGFEERYDRLIGEGLKANPLVVLDGKKKRGRVKQSHARNLVERMRDQKGGVLAFMYDFEVPFDNNLVERDIRMMKVKQKVSGCFRSERGARIFCQVRGYISTVKKQGYRVIEALRGALEGKPYIPIALLPNPP